MKCEYISCPMNKKGECDLKEVSMNNDGRCSFAWYKFKHDPIFGERPTTSEDLNIGFDIYPNEKLPNYILHGHPRLKYEVKKYFREHPEDRPDDYTEDF